MASFDVDLGRVTVAHVRTGVATRHRRLKEGRVARRKALVTEHERTKRNTNISSRQTSFLVNKEKVIFKGETSATVRHPRRCAQRGELSSSAPPSLSFTKVSNRIMRFRINFIAPSVESLEPLPSPSNFGILSAPRAGSWQSQGTSSCASRMRGAPRGRPT